MREVNGKFRVTLEFATEQEAYAFERDVATRMGVVKPGYPVPNTETVQADVVHEDGVTIQNTSTGPVAGTLFQAGVVMGQVRDQRT
jgi:hypothetical protein